MFLNNIRVIELGHAVAGPTAGSILADLGAEVIKIERPGSGDHFRDLPGIGPSIFIDLNRGKKSVALNLRDPRGYEIFLRLVRISDVVIDNLDPVASRGLGISYEGLSSVNPGIIYCKITGFGEGPYENLPAYDPMLQAISGIMSVTGFPPDRYVRAGISLVDMTGAFHCVIGVLAALFRRSVSGRGSYIEVSLFDASIYYMGYWITYYDLYGRDPEPLGTGHMFGAPYGLFKTSDGYIYISIVSDTHWKRFCQALGFRDLEEDPRYSSNKDRVSRKQELEEEVGKRLANYRLKDLFEILSKSGVPATPLYRVSDLLQDPHLAHRELISSISWRGSRLRVSLNPIRVDGLRPVAKGDPPELGEDTEEVLTKLLGISRDEIEGLRRAGVVV